MCILSDIVINVTSTDRIKWFIFVGGGGDGPV